MSVKKRRIITLIVIIVAAFVLGRLGMRFFLNLLLGGTMFGGDFL